MHLPSDRRYTVRREFCGYPDPYWVARFCGEWIGASKFKGSALMLAIGHKTKREGAMIIEAITDKNTTYQGKL